MSNKCSKEKWEAEEQKIIDTLSRHKISKNCNEWLRTICPNCEQRNWVFMSIRFEACKCFNCEKTFWISEKIYDDYKTELTLAEVFDYETNLVPNVFEGLENPN